MEKVGVLNNKVRCNWKCLQFHDRVIIIGKQLLTMDKNASPQEFFYW